MSKRPRNRDLKVLIGSYDDFGLRRMFGLNIGWTGSISALIMEGWHFGSLRIFLVRFDINFRVIDVCLEFRALE